MLRLVITLPAAALIVLAFGCSDDDCPNCPAPVTAAGFVTGSINAGPGVSLSAFIYGTGSVLPEIDSIRVGDSLLTPGLDYITSVTGIGNNDPLWMIQYREDAGPDHMYNHGDTARIWFWGDGNSARYEGVVLNPDSAAAHIISPLDEADTIEVGEPTTITWNLVPDAPFYSIMLLLLNYERLENDTVLTASFEAAWTADTSYTVMPETYPDSLAALMALVMPFAGPAPDAGSNVTGGWLTGKLISIGESDQVTLWGWVQLEPRKAAVPELEVALRQWTPAKIVEEVYRRARQ